MYLQRLKYFKDLIINDELINKRRKVRSYFQNYNNNSRSL